MKKMFVIFSLLSCIIGYSQSGYTVLNNDEYDQIKFGDTYFKDIKESNADIKILNDLVLNKASLWKDNKAKKTNAVTIEIYGFEIGEPQRVFNYNSGLMIAFSDDSNNQKFEIGRLETNDININGVYLKVGDPISKLNSIEYVIDTGKNKRKFVSIIREDGYCCPISISLDSNNKISDIVYYVIP